MLSKEVILDHLPRLSMDKRVCLPIDQGVYFLILGREILYIGASKCIAGRLACLSHHSIGIHLRAEAEVMVGSSARRDPRWHKYLKEFASRTSVAWLLVPGNHSTLLDIESMLIAQHNPRLNTSTYWRRLNKHETAPRQPVLLMNKHETAPRQLALLTTWFECDTNNSSSKLMRMPVSVK